MDTKKRSYVMTEKRKAAFEKMQQKRKEKLEERKLNKLDNNNINSDIKSDINSDIKSDNKSDIGSLHCSGQSDIKSNINQSSSSGTDSSNYESDKDHQPIIINNYDVDEPDAKIKITKVKRKINKPNIESKSRKNILNEYFEKNKDKFCESDGEIDEIDVTKQESKNLQKRFLTYAKNKKIIN